MPEVHEAALCCEAGALFIREDSYPGSLVTRPKDFRPGLRLRRKSLFASPETLRLEFIRLPESSSSTSFYCGLTVLRNAATFVWSIRAFLNLSFASNMA